jgi:hypothetical protein
MKTAARDFVIVLRPAPGIDGIRALRAALKLLLRRFGLRAIKVEPPGARMNLGRTKDGAAHNRNQ